MTDRLADWQDEHVDWRRDIHAHPELGFHETRTAQLVAERLESFGVSVSRGLATTGVVGTLTAGSGGKAIGLRADMDALPMQEAGDVPWRSTNDGAMHACGHDGHTTMLLAAARALADEPDFDGTVHFIFQPAEEMLGGGKVMIDDGLFDQHRMDSVWGMHNFPGLPVGTFCVRSGPVMAAVDRFDVHVRGNGGHAAIPHATRDPIPVAAEIIGALQQIVARRVDPQKPAVISVTKIHGGGSTYNVIPDEVTFGGGVRYFDDALGELIGEDMARIAQNVAAAHGCTATVERVSGYPATVNTPLETDRAIEAAAGVVGREQVLTHLDPLMASEDFAFMLQRRPGCYLGVGAGDRPMLHAPTYDFNDDVIPIGARYWVSLVKTLLPAGG